MPTTTTYLVSGMSCQHCVDAVTASLGALDGVDQVQVDLEAGSVRVSASAPPTAAAVETALDEAGFDLAGSAGSP